MTLVEQVKARIEANVAPLAGRVEEVADLAALVAEGALPQREVAAFVIPLGFNGRAPDDVAGVFMQSLDEVVGVVLVVKSPGDPRARRAIGKVDALARDVRLALCGWVPEGTIGDFRAQRGRLVSVSAGTVIFQLDFALQTQMRIVS